MSFGNSQVLVSAGSSLQPQDPNATPPPVPPAASGPLVTQAMGPAAGTALINGTQTLLSWKTPNDGQTHPFIVGGFLNITIAETGGQITVQFTLNGTLRTVQLFGASQGINQLMACLSAIADPNTTVSIVQQTPLTAGTATLAGVISGR